MRACNGLPRTGRLRPTAALGVTIAGLLLTTAPASATTAPEATPGCGTAVDPGRQTRVVDDREHLVYVPPTYDPEAPTPVLFGLHGTGGDGTGFLDMSRLEATADRYGFLLLAPTGGVKVGTQPDAWAWHVPGVPQSTDDVPPPEEWPDDVAYLDRVLDGTEAEFCIDADRVYATGHSNGGRMSSALACDRAERIAAVAPVSGLRAGVPDDDLQAPVPDTCAPTRPVSIVAFHGGADTTSPYDGSDAPYWGYGVRTALDRWAELDRCATPVAEEPIADSVALLAADRCAEGAGVALYYLRDNGHDWPVEVDGIEINPTLWEGLAAHRRS